MNKSVGFYAGRFAIAYMGTIAAVFAITYAFYYFSPDLATQIFEGGGRTGISIATMLVPMLLVAQAFYKYEQRRETRKEGWVLAFVCTVVAVVLSIVIFIASAKIFGMTDPEFAELKSVWDEAPGVLTIVFVGISLIYLLGFRLMLWSGLRGEVKKSERLAKRTQ